MWDYAVVTGVTPATYHATCREYEQNGYSLHESNHYRTPPRVNDSLRGAETEPRWDLVFRKAAKDISYGQMLINRYSEKLTEVAEKLLASKGLSGIEAAALGRDIKEFLFKGSPEDM